MDGEWTAIRHSGGLQSTATVEYSPPAGMTGRGAIALKLTGVEEQQPL
ncbi:MAG: hypothetical protein LBK03_03840 [Bacteroidales bacterium]|nr:hypothetical protein [Bacteroidales bacterium]